MARSGPGSPGRSRATSFPAPAEARAVSDPSDLVASGYDALYTSWNLSPTLRRIWQDNACGPDYPPQFRHISFLTMNELGIMADALRPDPRVLVDLACGAGGPGCWMARELGARLVGVDLSTAALTRASELAGAVGLGDRAEFHLGSFGATGLETASTDAVMSVDALQYAPDKAAAFAEAARILRPGGRMAFAAFELEPDRVAGVPVWEVDPIADYRPLCERAGLVVTSYAETSGWRHRVEAAFSAVVAERARLEAELGETAGAVLAFEASLTLELQPYRRRVLAVATNR